MIDLDRNRNMNDFTKTITYLSIGLSIPILLFFIGIMVSRTYTHYFDTHTKSDYGIVNTYFQPANLGDQAIREADKTISDSCDKFKSDSDEYDGCLNTILDTKVEYIYEIVENIISNANSINSELIQQGIYKNNEPNTHTYLVSFLEEMTESFFDYSEKLCLISLDNHSEVKSAQIQNRKCVIYQVSIYYSDLINLRSKWISDYILNKIDNNDIKSQDYKKTLEDERTIQKSLLK